MSLPVRSLLAGFLAVPLLAAGQTPSHADRVTLTIARGGTLFSALLHAGVERQSAATAVAALEDLFDPRQIRAGDRVQLELEDGGGARRLRSLHLATGERQDLTVSAGSDGKFATAHGAKGRRWSLLVQERSGSVAGSLREALAAAGVPETVSDQALAAFTADPDLPAEPDPESRFRVVYEATEGQGAADSARLRYASLHSGGTEHRVYRYAMRGGEVAFMTPTGRGLVPLHLEDPVPNAAITSPWGWRIHPVLGVAKFHRGVDFGAALGTPVLAAANGTITSIGWRGNYGRQIRLCHSSRLETTYAHLSRFARHLHPGSRVRRGQTIGYVGASGMATGPHLYFEVWIDGEQVDPTHNPALPIQLSGASLSQFQTYTDRIASSVTR